MQVWKQITRDPEDPPSEAKIKRDRPEPAAANVPVVDVTSQFNPI